MSALNLGALGLPVDPESAPSAPAVDPPAEPQSVTGIPAQPAEPAEAAPAVPDVEPDDDIDIPEGADNPDAVKSLIQAERAAARAAYKRAREAEAKLAEITEAAMPAEERLKLATERAAAAELKATKLAVGMKHGLSMTFSELLQGNDEQSIETHAKAVAQELQARGSAPAVPGVSLRGTDTPPPAAPVDPKAAHNQFLLDLFGQRRGA